MNAEAQTGPRLKLRTLGTLALIGRGGDPVLVEQGQHRLRLALLAVLAAAGETGRTRDQLLALFWPEVSQSRARHSLAQLLYAIRTSVDEDLIDGVNPLRLNTAIINTDVGEFHAAVATQSLELVVDRYTGPFLDGFHLGGTGEFDQWQDTERLRITSLYVSALEQLATAPECAKNPSRCVDWWRRLTRTDPLNATYAAGLMKSLADSGDHIAALQFAERYESLVREQLATSLPPAVGQIVEALRRDPSPTTALPRENVPPSPSPATVGAPDEGPELLPEAARLKPRAAALAGAVLLGVTIAAVLLRDREPEAPAAAMRTPSGTTQNIAAFELYMRGRDAINLRSDSAADAAVQMLREAIRLDSSFAPAWAALPNMYLRVASNARDGRRLTYPVLAESAARKAIKLDSLLPESHLAMGNVFALGLSNLAAAEAADRRALELGGGYRAREWLSKKLKWSGKVAAALDEALLAERDDPLSPTLAADVGELLCLNGRVAEGLERLHRLSSLQPPLLRVHEYTAICYTMAGRWRDVITHLRDARNPREWILLGYALGRAGRRDEVDRFMTDAIDRWKQTGEGALQVVGVAAGLGSLDQAFEWLERADDDVPTLGMVLLPMFSTLHGDPRLGRVRQRLGVAPE